MRQALSDFLTYLTWLLFDLFDLQNRFDFCSCCDDNEASNYKDTINYNSSNYSKARLSIN